jgi:hypothetical protein
MFRDHKGTTRKDEGKETNLISGKAILRKKVRHFLQAKNANT